MKRTTIVLPDHLAALLDWERRRRGVSAAEVVREALDAHLNRPTEPLSFIGIGRSGHRDTAERAEEILDQEWGRHLLEEMGRTPEPPRNPAMAHPADSAGADEARATPAPRSGQDIGGRPNGRGAPLEDGRPADAIPTDPQGSLANSDGDRR